MASRANVKLKICKAPNQKKQNARAIRLINQRFSWNRSSSRANYQLKQNPKSTARFFCLSRVHCSQHTTVQVHVILHVSLVISATVKYCSLLNSGSACPARSSNKRSAASKRVGVRDHRKQFEYNVGSGLCFRQVAPELPSCSLPIASGKIGL